MYDVSLVERVRRYHALTKEDMLGAGVPEPVADLQWQMYSSMVEIGCVLRRCSTLMSQLNIGFTAMW
jgi:hypothetical protein